MISFCWNSQARLAGLAVRANYKITPKKITIPPARRDRAALIFMTGLAPCSRPTWLKEFEKRCCLRASRRKVPKMSTTSDPEPQPRQTLNLPAAATPPEVAVKNGSSPDKNVSGASRPGLSKRRLAVAFAVAALSDALAVVATLAPPVEWALDFVTALVLFMVLGRRWLLLPALVMEAIPGLWVFPFWLLVVGTIAVTGQIKPKLRVE